MNREEIEAEAYRRFPIDSTDYEMMQRSDVMWDGFVEGAEWMQERVWNLIDEKLDSVRKEINNNNGKVKRLKYEGMRHALLNFKQLMKGEDDENKTKKEVQ